MRIPKTALGLAALATLALSGCSGGSPGLPAGPAAGTAAKVGEPAPDFRLRWADRDRWEFTRLRGVADWRGRKPLVLCFFPAAWSGTCTTEFETFRLRSEELAALGAEVVGVSGDYIFTLHEWAKSLHLPFTFLSDPDHRMARAYGSYDEATGFNRRTVWVIDREGTIRYGNPDFLGTDSPEAASQYERIFEVLRALPPAPPSP